MRQYPESFIIHPAVANAIKNNIPIVALESAVITHGLPQPVNFETAQEMQQIIRSLDAVPATIALIDGKIHIGLDDKELEILANLKDTRKISRRDFGYSIAKKLSGGTTVAGTMTVANIAGIKVFATGGIGGVHRNAPFDVSADLLELSRTPMIVVCAGAKAILDISATMEMLETYGVLIAGYQTDDFPAFFSRSSGIKLDCRINTPAEIAATAKSQWQMGISSAMLVVQPPPEGTDIPAGEINSIIEDAVKEAITNGIYGPAMTPYLLEKVKNLSGGKSMATNLALLKNNALLAAQIAISLTQRNFPLM